MTKIKFCGLTSPSDIEAANELLPEYIGIVFAQKSRRYVKPQKAMRLRRLLMPKIKSVGIFVNEQPETIAALMDAGVIDMAQLHGNEDASYMKRLRQLAALPIIKAFRIAAAADTDIAEQSCADFVLLDSSAGTGKTFDWHLARHMRRPYFLAGGLSPENIGKAVSMLHPFAVDVSTGIETNGSKDKTKMAAFMAAVRRTETA